MTVAKSTAIDGSAETTKKIAEKKNADIRISELMDKEDEITLEDLAPDGGWGWMIALAMILIIVSIIVDMLTFNIRLELINRC